MKASRILGLAGLVVLLAAPWFLPGIAVGGALFLNGGVLVLAALLTWIGEKW